MLFKDLFVSLNPKLAPAFEPLLNQLSNIEIDMFKDDSIELINRYQNFVINYIVQTTPTVKAGIQSSLNGRYEQLVKGATSLAKQLKMIKDSADPNISQNLAIKELIPILNSDSNAVDNIKLFRNRMDTYKNDILIESIVNLRNYAEASNKQQLKQFVDDLAVFALMQSGLQPGSFNYTKILPIEVYTSVLNDILNNFFSNDEVVNGRLIWKQFHQNNVKNGSINPRVQFIKKSALGDGSILVSEDFSDSQYDYLTKSYIQPYLQGNKQLVSTLLSQGRSSEVFDTVLYENTGVSVESRGAFFKIFTPVNKLGDGYRFTEVYTTDRVSILDKNNNIDPRTGALRQMPINSNDPSVQNAISKKSTSQLLLEEMSSFPAAQIPAAQSTAGSLGNIKLNIIENWVQTGQATTTIRNPDYHSKFYKGDGIYTSDAGNRVQITYRGLVQLSGDKIVGNNISYTKDQFAKAEGFGTWANFQQNAKYAGKTLMDGKPVHLYDIRPAAQTVTQPIVQAPSQASTQSKTDAEILASPEYKKWAKDNAAPMMTEKENLEYYKTCKM